MAGGSAPFKSHGIFSIPSCGSTSTLRNRPQAKHGIDFVEAQALWSDPERIEGPGRSTTEPRFLIVGRIAQTTWTATVTYRHEETIRIISVRRARDSEKTQYVGARDRRS